MPRRRPDADAPIADETIAAGDPRYDGFRIRELWAFVSVDPVDGQEGVLCALTPMGSLMPLVASDERRVESLRRIAETTGRKAGKSIVLKHFKLTGSEPIYTEPGE